MQPGHETSPFVLRDFVEKSFCRILTSGLSTFINKGLGKFQMGYMSVGLQIGYMSVGRTGSNAGFLVTEIQLAHLAAFYRRL